MKEINAQLCEWHTWSGQSVPATTTVGWDNTPLCAFHADQFSHGRGPWSPRRTPEPILTRDGVKRAMERYLGPLSREEYMEGEHTDARILAAEVKELQGYLSDEMAKHARSQTWMLKERARADQAEGALNESKARIKALKKNNKMLRNKRNAQGRQLADLGAALRASEPPKDGNHYAWVRGVGWCPGDHPHDDLDTAIRDALDILTGWSRDRPDSQKVVDATAVLNEALAADLPAKFEQGTPVEREAPPDPNLYKIVDADSGNTVSYYGHNEQRAREAFMGMRAQEPDAELVLVTMDANGKPISSQP